MVAQRALVRRPSPRLAEGLVTHIERTELDPDLALRQWDGYVEALREAGWEVVEILRAPDCPDSVFIEDAVVVFDDLAVITRPGAPERRAETVDVEAALAADGYRIAHILEPGTLDGGDVLRTPGVVHVGLGSRTNAEGVRQLADLVAPRGIRVIGVPTSRVLHLKSAVTALPDGTVIGYPPLVDDPALFERFLPVPEPSGSHVVLLGGDALLMADSAPRTAALLADLGYSVRTVGISEFEKLEGCVTCLSVRLRTPLGRRVG